jgi:hypothetical protein
MQTKHLIQATANVVKITSLAKGDVVKIVEDSSYDTNIYFGVVIDLLNSGDKSFIQIMRYKKSYRAIDCDIKTYSGEKDMSLFPATVDEVKEHLGDVIKDIRKDIETKEKEISDKRLALQGAEEFVSQETSKQLRSSSFKEVSQAEYNQLKQGTAF